MFQAPAKIAPCLVLLWCVLGCARFDTRNAPQTTALPSPESVSFDIYTIRVPLADPEINGPLWSEIDEQQLPVELRQRLANNGFRVGVIGNQLPRQLEQILNVKEAAPAVMEIGGTVTDFENEPRVRQRYLQVMAGHRANIICTGEQTRHPELSVLIRGADGQVNGRTYRRVMGMLGIKAFPQGDGCARLELVPELEHGDAVRRFEPSDGALRMEFGPPCEKFDLLRMEPILSAGQLVIITGRPDRPGSLGYQLFMDLKGDKAQQKVLMIRLVQSRYDNLFEGGIPQPVVSRDEEKEK